MTRESARTLSATHTFFLEEFNLKPGDFISYYARARDANSETTSDIYFIEVKPFEMEYRQSQQQQQQGGGGGEGGDQEQNALSRRQKDLIAATHRLIRESQKYTPQERKDGYETVAAGQEKLRTDTLAFLDRIGRRLGDQLEGQKELAEMAENLSRQRTNGGAPAPLRKKPEGCVTAEQRALQSCSRRMRSFAGSVALEIRTRVAAVVASASRRSLPDCSPGMDKMKNLQRYAATTPAAQQAKSKPSGNSKAARRRNRHSKSKGGASRVRAMLKEPKGDPAGAEPAPAEELIEEAGAPRVSLSVSLASVAIPDAGTESPAQSNCGRNAKSAGIFACNTSQSLGRMNALWSGCAKRRGLRK